MTTGYFHRLHEQTENRFWVNNPTPAQARDAIDAGAIACTTNPTYAAKMAEHPETAARMADVILSVLRSGRRGADAQAEVQRLSIKPILDSFLPIFEKSGGTQGFVSIQSNPILEDDPEFVLAEVLGYLQTAPNVIAKIPVTLSGTRVIDALVRKNVPIIATEVMAVAQATSICDTYRQACLESGHNPPFYVTHITGIFDEFIQKEFIQNEVKNRVSPIDPHVVERAGTILARRQHNILKSKGYDVTMLGGGARGTQHFTEMVSSDIHVTINWEPTAQDLINSGAEIADRFGETIPDQYIETLRDASATFAAAYDEYGLEPDDFGEFGPVAYFRQSFCRGWQSLSSAIDNQLNSNNEVNNV